MNGWEEVAKAWSYNGGWDGPLVVTGTVTPAPNIAGSDLTNESVNIEVGDDGDTAVTQYDWYEYENGSWVLVDTTAASTATFTLPASTLENFAAQAYDPTLGWSPPSFISVVSYPDGY